MKDFYEVEKIFYSNENDSTLSNQTDKFQLELYFPINSHFASLNIARIMAACPDSQYRDGRRAIDYANKGMKLIEKYNKYFDKEAQRRLRLQLPSQLAILAASYAENRNYQEAIKIQEQSIEIIRQLIDDMIIKSEKNPKEQVKKNIEKSLAEAEKVLGLYRDGKPYRSPIPVKPIN